MKSNLKIVQSLTLGALSLGCVIATAQPKHNMNITDGRKPLIMTPQMAQHQLANMRDHLEAIEGVVAGLSSKDFKAIQASAKRLASSPEMNQMCEHMGMNTPGFTKMGLALHKSGDELVAAAEKKDFDLVVSKLGATLKTCTACHSAFKQEIVSHQEFQNWQTKPTESSTKK